MVIRGQFGWLWIGVCWGAVNLALEKREGVTMGVKGRGEIRSEIGKITGMAADAPTTEYLVDGNRKSEGTAGS